MKNPTNRIEYLDLARAIAIISVLFFHYPFRDNIPGLGGFFNTYFLTLFFCISGFLTSPKEDIKWISNKAKRLLIPLLSFSILYIPFLAFTRDANIFSTIQSVLYEDSKGGYWFVYVLFMCFGIIWIIHRGYKVLHFPQWLYIILLLLPWFISVVLGFVLPQKIYYLFCLASFRRYYLFFLFGMLLNNQKIQLITTKTISYVLISIAYISGAILFSCKYSGIETNTMFMVWMVLNILGCLWWLETCRRICLYHKLSNFTLWTSSDSLGIYLSHYFILRSTRDILPPYICSSWIMLILYTSMIYIYTISLTRLIRTNSFTTTLFLGK